MKRRNVPKKRIVTAKSTSVPKQSATGAIKRAAVFRNGSNQAVRLPQELRFPNDVKEVRIRKQGDGLLISPVRPNWHSFFALRASVPDEFLSNREDDAPPQGRDPL
jgi:antitoxin VapB